MDRLTFFRLGKMAGNEVEIAKFLLANKGLISLPGLGLVKSIQVPHSQSNNPRALVELEELGQLTTEHSSKKADFYINGVGISAKQSGGCFLFNRVLRSNFLKVFDELEIENASDILKSFDQLVKTVHAGASREVHWSYVLQESSFRKLLEHLMMFGSPSGGVSVFPAQLILTAPRAIKSASQLEVLDFDSYFARYAPKIVFSIRRQWCGQSSSSEHKRALGIAANSGNAPWVFDSVAGSPRGWRSDWPVANRKTVYMLFIEVKP